MLAVTYKSFFFIPNVYTNSKMTCMCSHLPPEVILQYPLNVCLQQCGLHPLIKQTNTLNWDRQTEKIMTTQSDFMFLLLQHHSQAATTWDNLHKSYLLVSFWSLYSSFWANFSISFVFVSDSANCPCKWLHSLVCVSSLQSYNYG